MRKDDYPFLYDWFAISLRWLTTIGIMGALAVADQFAWPVAVVLLLTVVWNVFISVLAILNRRLAGHRMINVAVDTAISLALFILSGGLQGPLAFAGLYALFSGAIYFEWLGSLGTAASLSALQAVWVYFISGEQFSFSSLAIIVGFNLVFGVLLSLFSGQILVQLRRNYRGHVRKKREHTQKTKNEERSRMRAFYRLIEVLNASPSYQTVLDAAIDMTDEVMGEKGPEIEQLLKAVLLFEGPDLVIASSRRFSPRDQKMVFPAREGCLHEVISKGELQLIEKPYQDSELKQIAVIQDYESAVVLPMVRGMDAYGVILFAHPSKDFFNEERVELLEIFSQQAVVAIQNARIFQDLEIEKRRIIETQEDVRKKLARDLHDGPTQSISSIVMRLSVIKRFMEAERYEEAEREIDQLEDLANRTTKEVRHMLFIMRPLVLESEGLVPALQTIANRMGEVYQENVIVDADPTIVQHLDESKQTVIFYLVEEAVNNAHKHAQASQIAIRLKFTSDSAEKDMVLLEVIDNGVGFDVEKISSTYDRRGSLGMLNLQERTDLINGYLSIDSIPGKGTRIRVFIPLTEKASERIRRGHIKA